jgi:2,4-dichlorophenol 6-monooxygenase
MEIFRSMGLEEKLRSVSTRLPALGNGVLCTSLTGLEIGRYSCYGAGPHHMSEFAQASPSEMINSPQHLLEKVVHEHAQTFGADIRFSNELIHIEQAADHVTARIRERTSQKEYTINAKYAIGADGGRSVVAQQVGFGFKGELGLMHMQTSWLEADVTEYVAHRPACIYMLAQPGNAFWVGSGTFVNVKPYTEWLLNRQYRLEEGEPDRSDEAVIAYAREVLGIPDLKIKVKDTSRWQVNNVVATEYRKGRIFLAGDAAHRHPPSSGLGSNTCVQDAFNLAWKLKLVLSSYADEKLLESYNQERQPIGDRVVSHAIETLHVFGKVPQVLGFHHGQSTEDGYRSLQALFTDAEGQQERRDELRKVIDLQNLRSNPLGIQLGHRYQKSHAVVDDGTPFPEFKRDPVMFYQPTTHPGGYLPHAWVEKDRKQLSTLDIVPNDRFSLIVGIGGDPFFSAAKTVANEYAIDLPVYRIGYRCTYDDVFGQWTDIREITDRGAILVRPDRHIAWRSLDRPADVEGALRSAFSKLLNKRS